MSKRIDVLMPTQSQYGVMHHFTRKIYEALKRLGYECRLLEDDDRITIPCNDPPDLTLGLNGELRSLSGRYLCDVIERPHVACLIDPSYRFFSLMQSPYMIIACNDRNSCELLQSLNYQNTLFMPHAVEPDLTEDDETERIYEVFMLATFIDYEDRRNAWPELFPKPIVLAMEQAVELTLSDPARSFVQTFHSQLNEIVKKGHEVNPAHIDFVNVFENLEMYIRGKDRADLVRSIVDAKVHIIDSSLSSKSWKAFLGKERQNFIYHNPISYEENLKILKKTKIVLNSSPHIKEGAHERIFNGFLCGALPLTNETLFLQDKFQDGQNILFYRHNQLDKVNSRINEYLADETKRKKAVAQGREVVLRDHTWDQRMAKMMSDLEPILERIAIKIT